MKKNTLTKDVIDKIVHDSTFAYEMTFGKNTIVSMQLPNGFVLTESSACVDPANYDEKLGYDICVKKLTDRVWELEGYLLQQKLHEESKKSVLVKAFEECTIQELLDHGFAINLETPGFSIKGGF